MTVVYARKVSTAKSILLHLWDARQEQIVQKEPNTTRLVQVVTIATTKLTIKRFFALRIISVQEGHNSQKYALEERYALKEVRYLNFVGLAIMSNLVAISTWTLARLAQLVLSLLSTKKVASLALRAISAMEGPTDGIQRMKVAIVVRYVLKGITVPLDLTTLSLVQRAPITQTLELQIKLNVSYARKTPSTIVPARKVADHVVHMLLPMKGQGLANVRASSVPSHSQTPHADACQVTSMSMASQDSQRVKNQVLKIATLSCSTAVMAQTKQDLRLAHA
jgi:hypothetical protein